VLAASGSELELDLADWARPFEFNATLWSMPAPGSSQQPPPMAGGASASAHSKSKHSGGGPGHFCDQGQLYKELGSQLVDSLFQVTNGSTLGFGC